METFVHNPLDLTKDQIRLLRVSSMELDIIRCATEHFDRDSCPPYTAVSYLWGPPLPLRTISLNDKRFEIRENLWDFLEQLLEGLIPCTAMEDGKDFDTYYLWIDQLCIDQSSIAEKSLQVNRMARIYEDAHQVMAWLGKASSTSSKALKSLPHLTQQYQTMKHWPFAIKNLLKRASHAKENFAEIYNHELRGLAEIFQRPYWSRVWVAQEFILPQSLLIVCGADVIDWGHLESVLIVRHGIGLAYQKMEAQSLQEEEEVSVVGSALAILLARLQVSRDNQRKKTTKRETNMSLHDTVFTFYRLECEDPRDHLYGLMGLIRQDEKISTDYSKPASMVYCEMLQHLETSQLSVLYKKPMQYLGVVMEVTGREEEMVQKPALKAFNAIFGHKYPWLEFE
jgi:hypothetical protein